MSERKDETKQGGKPGPRRRSTAPSAGGKRSAPPVRRKRRIRWFRVIMLILILLLIVAGIVAAVVLLRGPSSPGDGDQRAVFGVKTILVEGNTHYAEQDIVDTSGIFVGQSVFSVDKRAAAEKILAAYPYVEKVTVDSPAFTTVRITLTEAQPAGIVAFGEGWLVIGENGKGLEALDADSDRLGDYLKIRSTLLEGAGVGQPLLSDRSAGILSSLRAALTEYALTDVEEIDLRDPTDIRINWKNQIVILLGNDTNLDAQIRAASTTVLPKILEKYGETAKGQLNMTSYSGSDSSRYGVYTPEELLPSAGATEESDATAPAS